MESSEGKCFALCCVMSRFADRSLTSLAHLFFFLFLFFSVFASLLFSFCVFSLALHLTSKGLDWVGGLLCGNTTAMCLGEKQHRSVVVQIGMVWQILTHCCVHSECWLHELATEIHSETVVLKLTHDCSIGLQWSCSARHPSIRAVWC